MITTLNRLLASQKIALGSLIVIWLLARAFPFSQEEPLMNPEVWNARKLLDYGFFERHGARLTPGMWTGQLPNPQDFNYTHYPLPMLWVFTLVYKLTGPWGGPVLVLALKLAGCVIIFKILDRQFERGAAWFASVLFAIAPCSILLDCMTDLTATSAVLWPAALWLLFRHSPAGGAAQPVAPWKAGLLVFAGGQISWFATTMVPSLMALMENWTGSLRASIRSVLKNRVALAIMIAGVLTFLCFLAQVVLYESDPTSLFAHIKLKMGSKQIATTPRTTLYALVALRVFIFTGAALLIGIAAGLPQLRRQRAPLLVAAAIYLLSFALGALGIPHHYYMDYIMQGSLLFPAAVLTAAAVQAHRRWLPWLLAVLAAGQFAYTQLIASVRTISPASTIMGKFVAENTAATDIIVSNLKVAQSPYKNSDIHAGKATAIVADRMMFFGFTEESQLVELPNLLRRKEFDLVYVYDKTLPAPPKWLERIRREGRQVVAQTLTFPPADLNFAERARAFIWYKVMRKGKQSEANPVPSNHEIEIYRLQPPPK